MTAVLTYAKGLFINFLPFLTTLFLGSIGLFLLSRIIQFYQKRSIVHSKVGGQLLQFFAFIVLIIGLIIASPLNDNNKEQLLSLVGILLAGAIALSSTTFLGNLMAGLMIRSLKKFGHGDFLRVGETFGRVSEIGLLHTEVQTIDRDLTTLPNLLLVTNPLKVISRDGTFISEEVSLGYDVHRKQVKTALLESAEKVGLKDCFVHIQSLGDFSVVYRISGFLKDVKTLITSKAKLRSTMIDSLHHHNIEIVSPTFMNQKKITGEVFIPQKRQPEYESHEQVEDRLFDKAEEAESKEKLQERLDSIKLKIETLQQKASDESTDQYDGQIHALERQKTRVVELLKSKSEEV